MTKQARLFAPNWKKCIVLGSISIEEGLKILNKEGLLLICVVDKEKKLIGVVSDSNIRRALLQQHNLSTNLQKIMTSTPVTGSPEMSAKQLRQFALDTGKREIPIVDSNGNPCDIFVLGINERRKSDQTNEQNHETQVHDHAAFILAGGLGSRLRTAVSDRPKPLAQVGDKTILDHLVLRLKKGGFRKIYFSVNYKADLIEQHIQNNPKIYGNVEVHLIQEEKRLGTAGSLGSMKGKEEKALLVCNADILTRLPFERVLQEHLDQKASITCVVKAYDIQVPYGVVELDGSSISKIQEKPVFSFSINAGIYVLNPDVIEEIQEDEHLNMPDLFQNILHQGRKVMPFLMHEYWLDVGTPEDFAKANRDAEKLFESVVK